MSAIPLGRFCWYELLTTDLDGSREFYRRIAGWETGIWQEGGAPPYTTWLNGGAPLGGVMTLPDELAARGAPSCWLPYVSTPDVDATAEKAAGLGGQLHNRVEVPGVGRMAVLADPGGAVFSAYQPLDATPGHDGPPAIGEFSWHEVISSDADASWSFYSGLFGWHETQAMDMGEAGLYRMYGRGEKELGGMMTRSEEMPPPHWLLYILVPNVHSAAEEVAELGGTVTIGPMEVPGGEHILQGIDPQGAAFALHSR